MALSFVYVYIQGPAVWHEIKYSVKSVRKYYSKEAKIFVVGDNPGITGITYVPHKQVSTTHGASRAFDITSKLLTICDNPEIPEDFILMYDDIIFLKKIKNETLLSRYSMGIEDEGKVFNSVLGRPSKEWKALFQNSISRLKKKGLPTYNYETHLPRIYNKTKIKDTIEKYRMNRIPFLFATMYYNTYWESPDVIITEPQNKHIKYGVYGPKPEEALKRDIPKYTFLNYNDPGLNKELMSHIKNITR